MTLLAIPGVISSVVSALSQHGHKKGVHGADSAALNSTSSPDTSSPNTASGSQGLFGSIMDAAEKLVGMQTRTSTTAASSATATPAANAGTLSPVAMIAAARSALQKI